MNKYFAIALLMTLMVSGVNAAVITFEDMTLNNQMNVGQSFTTSGVNVTCTDFYMLPNNPYNNGYVKVENGSKAGGAGNELSLVKICVSFNFGTPMDGLSLQYGKQSGIINLEINNQLVNVQNFSNVPMNVGGALVFSTADAKGALVVIGNINSFSIGGDQLWIDNIVASTTVPEPATLMLLGLGGLMAARKRRQAA